MKKFVLVCIIFSMLTAVAVSATDNCVLIWKIYPDERWAADRFIRFQAYDITPAINQSQLVTLKLVWEFLYPFAQNLPQFQLEDPAFINIFGSWNPESELTSVYSSPINRTGLWEQSVTFIAPSTSGTYDLRIMFMMNKSVSDYFCSNVDSDPTRAYLLAWASIPITVNPDPTAEQRLTVLEQWKLEIISFIESLKTWLNFEGYPNICSAINSCNVFYTCSDSDGGMVNVSKGSTVVRRNNQIVGEHTDYCTDSNSLLEGFCFNQSEIRTRAEQCNSTSLCDDGACKNVNCYNDSQCGISGNITETSCEGNMRVWDFRQFSCHNSGTVLSYCTKLDTHVTEACPDNQKCLNGQCTGNCFNTYFDCMMYCRMGARSCCC